MNLKEALQETGIAEVYYDGYTATVRDGEGEFGDKYRLTIATGGMPPHFSKDLDNLEQVEKEMRETHAFQPINWRPVDSE